MAVQYTLLVRCPMNVNQLRDSITRQVDLLRKSKVGCASHAFKGTAVFGNKWKTRGNKWCLIFLFENFLHVCNGYLLLMDLNKFILFDLQSLIISLHCANIHLVASPQTPLRSNIPFDENKFNFRNREHSEHSEHSELYIINI